MKPLRLLFSLFFLVPFSHAQSFNYHRYTVEDGLPSSQTFDLLQDNNKFIWIASDKGVSRFDGYTFTNFGVKEGLPQIPVYKLYMDPFDRIWFLSVPGELSYFYNGKIIQYKYNELLRSGANDFISGFQVTKDSVIWIGTISSGAFKVHTNGRIEQISKNDPKEKEYPALQIDNDLVMCYSTQNTKIEDFKDGPFPKQLRIFEGDKLKYSTLSERFNTKKMFCLKRKNGHVIYASHGLIIDYYKGNAIRVFNDANEVIALFEDSDSCLWVSYYEGGLRKFSPNRSPVSSTGQLYFSHKQISKVLEDYEHGFWFSTLHDGVIYAPGVKVENLLLNEKTNDEDEEKTVAIETDGHDRVFIGTNKSAVFVFSGSKRKDKIELDVEKSGIVKNIFYDSLRSVLYISTYGRGHSLDRDGQLRMILRPGLSMSVNKKGVLYAGYYNSVLRDYPNNVSECIFINQSYPRADAICFDDQNVLWIGNHLGLFYWRNEKVSVFEAPEAKTKIQCLASVKNSIFVGTAEGKLLEVNTHTMKLFTHPVTGGSIYHMLSINDSILGISSSNGALFYNIKKRTIQYRLTRVNGLSSNEVRQMALLKDTLYVVTFQGVSYLRLDHLVKNTSPPRIHILGCQVDSVNYIGQNNPQFGYSKNFITFNFVGLAYRNLGKVQYQYRLKGYADEWKPISVNTVQFPFLPPGDYVFEVKAINEDGMESDSPASFRFTILAPFWRTAWFIGLVVLLLFGIIVLVFTIRYRRLKERNNMLLQINDLRQKAMSLQMNPHFVFNSLNSIQSFVLSEDSYKATKYLARFAKLIRMGLHHSTVNVVRLEEEINLLNLYLDLEQMRFRKHFQYRIDVDEKIQAQQLMLPPMLIQPLVENAIKHGVEQEKTGTMILIGFYQEKEMLMCRIEDNGKGIKATSMARHTQEVNVHQSMGMNITKQRIRLFCEKEKHPFYFEVIDKSDLGLGETGTIITFTIPFTRND